MTRNIQLLDCPLCAFAVRPEDDYVLRLHFEQVHTTDSPFIIKDDPEPLPPPLPPRPSASRSRYVEDTTSEDEDGNTVQCPESECGETVLLSEYNDHLDYHAAESLSFDDTTGQYRSRRLVNMKSAIATATSTLASKSPSKPSFIDQHLATGLPDGPKRHDDASRRVKKKTHRRRASSVSSEKSTLSRSILSFVPFANATKKLKPPASNIRLGVSLSGANFTCTLLTHG